MAVVLVHPNEQAARQNVELLRRRIEEWRPVGENWWWAGFVDAMEIHAEGVVLLGKLWGDRTASLWQFPRNRNPFLLHE